MTRKIAQRVDGVIAQARDYLGYRALPDRGSTFGQAAGYPNQTWNGSFLTALFTDYDEPKFTATNTALAHYIRNNRNFRVPKRGDVVFYAFSADGQFGQPAVGLVTEVLADGSFKAIEGQTSTGFRRGSQDANGVFERTRYSTDVLAFARPRYATRKSPAAASASPTIRVSTVQPGKKNQQIETLQLALGQHGNLQGAERGTFDSPTQSAYAEWQRRCGLVGADASGVPDKRTLEQLAELDGRFTVRD